MTLIATNRHERWLFALCVGTALSIVLFTRWRTKNEQLRRARRKKKSSINIGGIFGMDVGGTLSKIVYFEADIQNGDGSNQSSPSASVMTTDSSSMEQSTKSSQVIHRTSKFSGMDTPDYLKALQELYSFMNKESPEGMRDDYLCFYSKILGGKLHFLNFETRKMPTAIAYIGSKGITDHIRTIGCTGGGAHKYAREIEDQLDIKAIPMDELGCLLKGMDFAFTNVTGECYTYRYDVENDDSVNVAMEINTSTATSIATNSNNAFLSTPEKSTTNKAATTNNNTHSSPLSSSKVDNQSSPANKKWSRDSKYYTHRVEMPINMFTSKTIFPYLVVNIGSGVSILKVSAPGHFERVSGSSVGGGTYWGLCRLLTSCASFEEVLDLAESGDASEVDMLVKDIYGGSYESMNLNGSMVASSFGKLVMKDEPRDGVKEEDLAIALLMMITNNIGQVSYLNAQLHGCSKIFFVGNFLRHNPISCRRLSFAIDFWSKGKMEALFLKHEGYLGALGTFLQSAFGDDVDTILSMGHGNGSNVLNGDLTRISREQSMEESSTHCKSSDDEIDDDPLFLSDMKSHSSSNISNNNDIDVTNIYDQHTQNHQYQHHQQQSYHRDNNSQENLVSQVLSWSRRGLASYRKRMLRYRKKLFDWRNHYYHHQSSSSNNNSSNNYDKGNKPQLPHIDTCRHSNSGSYSISDSRDVNDRNTSVVISDKPIDSPSLPALRTLCNRSDRNQSSIASHSNDNESIQRYQHCSFDRNDCDNITNELPPKSPFGSNSFRMVSNVDSIADSDPNNFDRIVYDTDQADYDDLLLSSTPTISTSMVYETGAGSEDETSPLNEPFVRRRAALGLSGLNGNSPPSRFTRRAFSQDADEILPYLRSISRNSTSSTATIASSGSDDDIGNVTHDISCQNCGINNIK